MATIEFNPPVPESELIVFDRNGKVASCVFIAEGTALFDIPDGTLPPGLYFYNLFSSGTITQKGKININEK